MADVQLIRENECEMYFAHRPGAGVVIALIGAGLGWLFWENGRADARWIGAVVGFLFFAIGIAAAFWRYELRIDLVSRTYHRRKGFWPNPQVEQGSLQEIEHVALTMKQVRASKSSSTHANWEVGIKLRGDEKPISVGTETAEENAYRNFESLARRLRVNAVDRTGPLEKITPWDELDARFDLHAKPAAWESATEIPALPAESRIEFDPTPAARRIILPADARAAGWLLIIFGGFFGSFGAFFLWMKITGAPMKENPEGAGWVVAPVFLLVGLGIMGFGAFALAAREVVREDTGALIFATVAWGREWRVKRMEKREIEEISIKEATRQLGRSGAQVRVGSVTLPVSGKVAPMKEEVVVRSDAYVARIGSDMTEAEREWLRATLSVMASS